MFCTFSGSFYWVSLFLSSKQYLYFYYKLVCFRYQKRSWFLLFTVQCCEKIFTFLKDYSSISEYLLCLKGLVKTHFNIRLIGKRKIISFVSDCTILFPNWVKLITAILSNSFLFPLCFSCLVLPSSYTYQTSGLWTSTLLPHFFDSSFMTDRFS